MTGYELVLMIVCTVIPWALLWWTLREGHFARVELGRRIGLLTRQYDEMKALAIMSSWGLRRDGARIYQALVEIDRGSLARAGCVLVVASMENSRLQVQDSATWVATPIEEVKLTGSYDIDEVRAFLSHAPVN